MLIPTVLYLKKNTKLIFVFLVTIFFVGVFVFENYFWKNKLIDYYDKLNEIEILDNVEISGSDLEKLNKCKSLKVEINNEMGTKNECLKDFYENYTLKNGVNKAFSHMHLLEEKFPKFVSDCHYISHGIGHAQLILSDGIPALAFAKMSYDSFINNLATCGNGYFHGVIEEYSKDEKNKQKLIEKLKPVCEDIKELSSINKRYRENDCFHGVGHAAFIQLNYKIDEALNVCEAITMDKNYLYNCYSGVFMQALADFPVTQLFEVKDGRAKYLLCDSLNEKYQPACYFQNSSQLNLFSSEPFNFAKNIHTCKQIKNKLNRLSCVSFFAAYAFTNRYTNIKEMCLNGTSNKSERIMCVGIIAVRAAKSLDTNEEKTIYREAVQNICKILPINERIICIKNILEKQKSFTIPSQELIEFLE